MESERRFYSSGMRMLPFDQHTKLSLRAGRYLTVLGTGYNPRRTWSGTVPGRSSWDSRSEVNYETNFDDCCLLIAIQFAGLGGLGRRRPIQNALSTVARPNRARREFRVPPYVGRRLAVHRPADATLQTLRFRVELTGNLVVTFLALEDDEVLEQPGAVLVERAPARLRTKRGGKDRGGDHQVIRRRRSSVMGKCGSMSGSATANVPGM